MQYYMLTRVLSKLYIKNYLHISNDKVLIYSLLYMCNIYERLTLSLNR